uniref:Uncharacterized protein n=1 Tax=Setaria italica TaxID=4555 RepID=K3YFG6_SETIT
MLLVLLPARVRCALVWSCNSDRLTLFNVKEMMV